MTYEGQPIVKGKRVTGFTNSEEDAVHLTKVVPFLVEDELRRLGSDFEKAVELTAGVDRIDISRAGLVETDIVCSVRRAPRATSRRSKSASGTRQVGS